MSYISIAKTLLPTVLDLKVKPLLDEKTRQKYFPSSLDQQILREVQELSQTLDEVKNEIARLRIQPPRRAFNRAIDFYRRTVVPTIISECERKSPNEQNLLDLAEKLDNRCIEFSGEINNSWGIMNEKTESCDFAVRLLFQLTKDMNCLYLAMLSWTRGIFDLIPDKQYKVDQYDGYIRMCLDEFPSSCQEYAAKLENARLSKMHFTIRIKSHETFKHGVPFTEIDKVYCLYQDTFSSSEKYDPYKGSTIYHKINKEYEIWPWAPNRTEMATAAVHAEDYQREYDKHFTRVRELSIENVKNPNEEFLTEWQRVVAKK